MGPAPRRRPGHSAHDTGAQGARAALLAVECDQHAGRLGARGADERHRFAHGSAGRDHIVDDEHATAQRRADDRAALAVVLRFLAVERDRHVASVAIGQRNGHRCRECDALVGRTEQHVERQLRAQRGLGIGLAERELRRAGIEQAGVEEIGAGTA
jgi:hypothetical protein